MITYSEKRFFDWEEDDTSVTIRNSGGSYGGGSEVLVCCPTVGVLCASDYNGAGSQYVEKGKLIPMSNAMSEEQTYCMDVGMFQTTEEQCLAQLARQYKDPPIVNVGQQNYAVRRLTERECERLQGFPDDWTLLDDWVDAKGKTHKGSTASSRYKALGNSIGLPFWYRMFQRMAKYLPEDAALGSLFDGIGGFPLCWEDIHGIGTAKWASEIEDFPIAVTKKHFDPASDPSVSPIKAERERVTDRAAYGFMPRQGAKALGMGWQKEVAPTLNTTTNAGVLIE